MTSKEYLESLKSTKCDCGECVKMCTHRPCWPTPKEAEEIIKAGFKDKLALDFWADWDKGNIYILAPAPRGYEGKNYPEWPTGICTLLKDKKCALHDLNLKPIEGRLAHHDMTDNEADKIHQETAKLWDTLEGKNLVEEWRKSK